MMNQEYVEQDCVVMLYIQQQKNVKNIKQCVFQMEMNVCIIYNHVHHIKVIKINVNNILE